MTPEVAQFSNKGMNQDISVSKATNEFAFENYNIRITAVNDNTLLSVTNEKLPVQLKTSITTQPKVLNKVTVVKKFNSLQAFCEYPTSETISVFVEEESIIRELIIRKGEIKSSEVVTATTPIIKSISVEYTDFEDLLYLYYVDEENIPEQNVETLSYIPGKYLGHSILNEKLVIFTKKENVDNIIVLRIQDNTLVGEIKYSGNLNFQLDKPIETLPYYESELVQKVYWVDGVNQPRVINVESKTILKNKDTQFDFNPTITKFPEVTITKEYSGVGLFPAGVIQYFVSYYNKYGAETGIVWSSDLQYVTEYNRAAGPDETVVCNFKIDISNVDITYDYARVYSMQRTSLNTTPICKIVGDININNLDTISIIDTNTNTETIDPTQLLFLGGDNFIASTLTQKDDVLFLGDLEIKNTPIPQAVLKYFEDNRKINEDGIYSSEYLSTVLSKGAFNNKEEYLSNKCSSRIISGLKYGEIYRVGIQFQSKDSSWTMPIWIGDIKNYIRPFSGEIISLPKIQYEITSTLRDLVSPYYINYRLLIVEPTYSDRSILAQGIVSPTVFNIKDRITKRGPYGISSWIARPRNGKANFEHLSPLGNSVNDGEYTNLETCEIQNSINELPIIDENNTESNFVLSISMYGGSLITYYLNILNVKDSYTSEGEPINNFIPENIKSVYWSGSYSTTWYPQDMPQEEFDKIVKLFEEQLHLEGGINGLTLNNFKSVFSGDFDTSYSIVGNSTWSTGDFRVKGGAWIKRTNEDAEKHSIYTIVKTSPLSESLVETKSNNYYVDSSLVSFHSPEIDNVRALVDNTDLKFRIIGIAPIKNTLNDVIVESKTSGNSADSGFIKPDNTSYFLNAPMYRDNIWNEDNVLEKQSLGDYYMYLWNKKGSIIGQTADSKKLDSELKPVDIDRTIAELQHKIIALKTISDGCISLPSIAQLKYDVTPTVFSSDIIESKYVKGFDSYSICQGNYDNVVVTQDKYKVFWNNSFSTNTDSEVPALQADPVSIKYTKTPHVLFNLKYEESYEILPYLLRGEKSWNLYSQYNKTSTTNPTYYSWLEDGKFYKQRYIDERCTAPYFYIGELYRDIDYSTLYGGYNENDLEQSNWIPISNPTNIEYSTNDTWGDTYYQRWECLNTYPSTEEDLNSVVDIVSFMVETHINLEGRYDKNRNGLNILNARPDNFNKINPVYSQTNNYFTYNILDEKFNQNKYFNQVAFSLQKTPTSEIDTWCNISLASTFNLDGKYGKLNKLITVNDAVLAFQDKALSVINFNNRTAISTEDGVPIEIANSGKVNGYSIISSNIGCQNKLSICEASSGVYFIDDLNKTMYGFNREGLSNISSKGMSMWFKKNLTGKEKCFYDKLTNDVYVTNDTDCLVYNEALDAFTSFMDYNHIYSLFNFEGKSILLDKNNNDGMIDPKLMFAGDYTNDYYIQYKINPEPLTDKIFTNIEYIADKLNDDSIDSIASKKNLLYPFTEFEVWNEYQYGINNLTKGRTYPNFERKFRIWRADIPRDESNGRDRIRNPWIYLKLNNKDNNNAKMAFHSFLVKYYK